MKKLGVALLFIIGFIVVFLVSGYVSYNAFNQGEQGGSVASDFPEGENVSVPLQNTQNGNLTIVTPGLSESDAVVRYGSEIDILKNGASVVSEVASHADEVQVEAAVAPVQAEVNVQSQSEAEVQSQSQAQTEAKVQSQSQAQTEVKAQAQTEEKKEKNAAAEDNSQTEKAARNEEQSSAAQAPAAVETPVTQEAEEEVKREDVPEEIVEEKPKVELNPNVQTSDSGM